jgi:hypothetical protein
VDREIVNAARRFLGEHDSTQPLFLTVSVNQPHPPFELVRAFEEQFPIEQVSLPPNYQDDLASKPPVPSRACRRRCSRRD